MSRNITPEEFQLVYDLVFPLHPREDVALRVTMDACDFLRGLERSQARRRRSERHWKADMTEEQLLQYAAYTVSYYRELDQESSRPVLPPFYQPTREDRIVRYVKHLIFRTYLLNARSIAIGIGCLLYAYKPSEIADLLFLFEERSLRTIKMRLAEDLRKRFANADVVSPDGKSMRTIPASDNDRLLVEGALKAFTPWGTDHLEPPTPDGLMLDMLLDEENSVSDWQRKHALIDPQCAGLARLINEYNKHFSSNPIFRRLTDPRGNLMLPDFGGGPEPSLERFQRRLLSDSDIMFLNERRKPSGPWAYLPEVLSLLTEFVPMEDLTTDWPILINAFCDEDRTMTTPEQQKVAGIGYGLFWHEIQQRYRPRPTKTTAGPASSNLDRATSHVFVFRPLGTVAPVHTGDLQPRCNEAHHWVFFCQDVGTDGEQDGESEPPGLFDVFEGHCFLPLPDFALDVDIGSEVNRRGSFTNDKQATRNYGKIRVFDVCEAGESPSGLMFYFTGHGFGRPPSSPFGNNYGEQEFLTDGIDGAICVLETKYKHYDKAGAPFVNQSRPTQAFTFQRL